MLVVVVVAYLRTFFLPRHKLALEAVALRQQLAVFKRNILVRNWIASIGCSGLRFVEYGLAEPTP